MPYELRWFSGNCVEQPAGHRRWSASPGFPCLYELAGDAEQFREEPLAQSEPIAKSMDGDGIKAWRVRDFDRFHR